MIRELHVYGRVKEVGSRGKTNGAQHLGIGKELLVRAEKIARENQYTKMAVISGIGVRDYYRKYGYEKTGSYMIKRLDYNKRLITIELFITGLIVLLLSICYLSLV